MFTSGLPESLADDFAQYLDQSVLSQAKRLSSVQARFAILGFAFEPCRADCSNQAHGFTASRWGTEIHFASVDAAERHLRTLASTNIQ